MRQLQALGCWKVLGIKLVLLHLKTCIFRWWSVQEITGSAIFRDWMEQTGSIPGYITLMPGIGGAEDLLTPSLKLWDTTPLSGDITQQEACDYGTSWC
jgi:hypothetical protein